MTEQKNITIQNNKIVVKPLNVNTTSTPIVIRKASRKGSMIELLKDSYGQLSIKNMNFGSTSTLYKEDVIYDSIDRERDSPSRVTIVNKFNLLTNASRTTATYYGMEGKISEKTSDKISKVIGQKNYDTVLAALCSSNLSEDVKAQAILALLANTSFEDRAVQTENSNIKMENTTETRKNSEPEIEFELKEDKCCQTDENCMDIIYKQKQKRRTKRSVLTPYVVKDLPQRVNKKVPVKPENSEKTRIIEDMDKKIKFETREQLPEPQSYLEEKKSEEDVANSDLPELHLNEDTNSDVISNFSLSVSCKSDALRHAETSILNSVGQRTMNFQPSNILLPGGSSIMVPVKPEDDFHLVTPEILNNVTLQEKRKLLWYQAILDWKRCLDRDADGYLPLHNAVINKDLDMVQRQCIVLKSRQESLDITGGNMTALQISILQDSIECTGILLKHGASPLYTDEEHRTSVHLGACESSDQLRAVIGFCRDNARKVMLDHEEQLWKPEYEEKTDEELGAILVDCLCKMADSQGFTPLMLAAKSGNYTNVKTLVEACPSCVNAIVPCSGMSALFLATAEACMDAERRGNKSKIADHFQRTITILLENGADTTIVNYSGTSINDLLTESNNAELSGIFSSTLTAVKFPDGAVPPASFDKFMLIKNEKGDVGLTDIKTRSYRRPKESNSDDCKRIVKKTKDKPIILENISLPTAKKVVVYPQSLIKKDGKDIDFKLPMNSKSNPESVNGLPKKPVIIVKKTSANSKLITIPLKPSNVQTPIITEVKTLSTTSEASDDNTQSPDWKITDTKTLSATSESSDAAGEVQKQAVKRKSSSESGPSDKKTKNVDSVLKG